jgi:glucokinase
MDRSVKKGLIEARDNSKSKAGRLRINATYGHVIAVDIGGSNLRVALADMGGTVLGRCCVSTRRTSSAEMVVEQISSGVGQLLEQTSVPRSSLLAVAAGAPGVTDSEAGVVLATSYLKGWRNVPLRDLLESSLRIPAAVENDVKVGAIGESWRGAARGVRDFVFLAIGTGIAAGIFANGHLVQGVHWTAGEVGYLLVPGVSEEPVKRGIPGPLESVIGGEGVRQQWLRACDKKRRSPARNLTATEIFESAKAGDRTAKEILERTARLLAYAVYNMSVVLDCSLFVLGGGVGMSEPLRNATEGILEL